jgi:hypothetical protein
MFGLQDAGNTRGLAPMMTTRAQTGGAFVIAVLLVLASADYYNRYPSAQYSGLLSGAVWSAENKLIFAGGDVDIAQHTTVYDIASGRWG